jgi:dynactin complex subunit|tara:strand:+ start:384 stop:647 length:264 start_codon:yes stop_codon:yes gene_type:complete
MTNMENNYIKKLTAVKVQLTASIETQNAELEKLEKEFADLKLNPYGITSIDFAKRQELSVDTLKMEGTLMGIDLALETYEEEHGKSD